MLSDAIGKVAAEQRKRKRDMKEKQNNPMSESADQAIKTYEEALRTGLKFQNEAWQSWCAMLNQSPLSPEWQKRYSHAFDAANSIMPAAQKRMEEAVDVMEKNARLGAELMKKAMDAAQTTAVAESQSKWMEFLKTSLDAAQFNVESLMRINSRAMESFTGFVQKNSEFARTGKTA
jgi:hypothetical protein